GFEPLLRRSWARLWSTLRAGVVVVTHGLGDANRFGVMGARLIHLGHGAPLKKMHLDSPVTTSVGGPAPLRALLQRMYLSGTRQVTLYVAGSIDAAERLRSAYRVAPGKVRVLGDARDDELAMQVQDPARADEARAHVRRLLKLPAGSSGAGPPAAESLVLYAPTWRDGAEDPAVPSSVEIERLSVMLAAHNARLVIRSHPLGTGAYAAVLGGEAPDPRVRLLGADLVRDITPLLGAFDAVITDYSSIAIDFSLFGRPILWFAPDLAAYSANRGLYEPLEVTAAGRVLADWRSVQDRLAQVLVPGSVARRNAEQDARALAARFNAHPEGGSAARVLAEIRRLGRPIDERIAPGGVFFESFYGRQISCNPLALDREIAACLPELPRYWSVTSERIAVPEGATPVLVGGSDWFAARRQARLLVVNDWLRYGFAKRRGQLVLQTWHGTMLKHLALGRPGVGWRTRIAIRRESRRWDLLLSQNPHSSEQFRSSYAFRGEILELGYPRDDRLARSLVAASGSLRMERIPVEIEAARRALGVPAGSKVLGYVPTWREGAASPGTGSGVVDLLDV
ncbi:MAG: CDP-glycerol glycerophosphotransferase family protein, partial [Actinobacteria bacterium]|nr:CDP-glycerol glycerophosphotransferase family protein [Actinomycetota bacterium]